jgi:hypothetical protein
MVPNLSLSKVDNVVNRQKSKQPAIGPVARARAGYRRAYSLLSQLVGSA